MPRNTSLKYGLNKPQLESVEQLERLYEKEIDELQKSLYNVAMQRNTLSNALKKIKHCIEHEDNPIYHVALMLDELEENNLI